MRNCSFDPSPKDIYIPSSLQLKEADEEVRAIIDEDNAKYAAELIAEDEKKNGGKKKGKK